MPETMLKSAARWACIMVSLCALGIGYAIGFLMWHNDNPPLETYFEGNKEGMKFEYNGTVSILGDDNSFTVKFNDLKSDTNVEPIGDSDAR